MRLPTRLSSPIVAACIPAALAVSLVNMPPVDSGWNSRLNDAFADLDSLRIALTLKTADDGAAPTESQGLEALASGPRLYLDMVKRDPWGHPYAYHVGASGAVVYSVGPNGIDERGGGDDVTTDDKSYRCTDFSSECGVTRRDVMFAGPLLLALAGFALLLWRGGVAGWRLVRGTAKA